MSLISSSVNSNTFRASYAKTSTGKGDTVGEVGLTVLKKNLPAKVQSAIYLSDSYKHLYEVELLSRQNLTFRWKTF